MTTTSIAATDLQRQVGSILRRVGKDGEHLIVERGGIPIAVLIPYHDYKIQYSPTPSPSGTLNPSS
jgi:prevent-host-death family protein